MAITMQIIIEQDEKGVGTRIEASGPCTELEAALAAFIHQSIIAALETKEGFKHLKTTVCETKEITQSINGENKNVH
ncbi:hypothetical protein [Candidatus Erwinia dacicola]|uniref:Uncharacterized protein n=1 Tax=Candidatus Erwinia dacicola TaxID=252393 RepID=A0A1E7YUW2_9GAMM|nr:hypothetical protein [Candidatus Erwinia dacicola]OFC58155.1 hypothetical protein BBW68_03260 [Candidatus Erwinia dacicola]RAP70273.1 hypothetical protein ACZ87_02920 [Candidatus Erwinia dacicola]